MSAPTIEQILSLVMTKSNGDPDDQMVLSSIVEHSIRRTDTGISIIDVYGKVRTNASDEPMTFPELLGEIQSQWPELFKDSKPEEKPDVKQAAQAPSSGYQGLTLTEQMMAEAAAQNSADNRKAQAADIAALGNPWSKGKLNFTHQMRIENLDPVLAAELKAAAGVAA